VKAALHAGILLAIAVLLAVSTPARGEIKPPGAVSGEDSLESSPIVAPNAPAASPKSDQTTGSSSAFDVTRVLLALVGVIALIFLLKVFAKRLIPGVSAQRASSAVKILGRCAISARQNLFVVQFGKRLVLVGDAGANLNPLCEITDPDEIAGILAQAREESISVARRFESLFGRARNDFADSPDPQPGDHFDDSHDVKPDDPALQQTQKELSDLRDKVRDVARQIGRA
jgi:flagellar biogenesis protein FliO